MQSLSKEVLHIIIEVREGSYNRMKSCCPYKHVKQSLLLHPFEMEWTRLICTLEREVTIEVREGSYNRLKSCCLSKCDKTKTTITSF